MPVDTQHPQYQKHFDTWKKCRDAIEGEEAVKSSGKAYLPELSDQDSAEYESYKLRASFYGATGRTLKGLVGLVAAKAPQSTFPDAINAGIASHLGSSGESAELLSSQLVEEVLGVSRAGVLVDADSNNGDPYAVLYYAENIINWEEAQLPFMNDKQEVVLRKVPTLVVLQEEVEIPNDEDPFVHECETRWRVLRLLPTEEDGPVPVFEYIQEVWRKEEEKAADGSRKDVWVLLSRVSPTFRGGRKPGEITFVPITPMGLTFKVEKSPLLDLVNMNMAHYRNSADLEHGRHFTALPTLYLAGFDPKETKVRIGSSRAWVTENPQAKAEYVEFQGQGLDALVKALEEKEAKMAVLGARLLEERKLEAETATAVRLRQSGEKSVLATVASTVSMAMERVLRWTCLWIGQEAPANSYYTLNQDYEVTALDAATLTALMTSLQGGGLSFDAFYYMLNRAGMYPENWNIEKERQAIEAGVPMGPMGEDPNADPENQTE